MKGKGKQKELKVLDATGMSKSMNGLISIVFKLHDGTYNVVSNLEPLPGTAMKDKLYNSCIKSVQKYASLSVVERSNLHVLLSSCVNTVSMNYRTAVENIIGSDVLIKILSRKVNIYSENCTNNWVSVKKEMVNAFEEKGIKGLQLFITKQRLRIFEEELEEKELFGMKMFDLFNMLIDEIKYGGLSSQSSELDFSVYWIKVFNILSRKTEDWRILLCRHQG